MEENRLNYAAKLTQNQLELKKILYTMVNEANTKPPTNVP